LIETEMLTRAVSYFVHFAHSQTEISLITNFFKAVNAFVCWGCWCFNWWFFDRKKIIKFRKLFILL